MHSFQSGEVRGETEIEEREQDRDKEKHIEIINVVVLRLVHPDETNYLPEQLTPSPV